MNYDSAALQAFEAEEKRVPTVLIADDDPGVVRALAARCKKLGIEVSTATDGLQAILKAKQTHPDLMIVDINMPEVDGFKVCEWVLNPNRPAVEVIVLTGNKDEETYDRCDALGAYYVPKSSETWEIIRAIIMRTLPIEGGDKDSASDILPVRSLETRAMPADGPRVLVVDDDPDVVRALQMRLKKLGATVFVAHDGIDAFRVAVREQPHAVIADYMMPRAGGHYLIWRLRDNKSTANIPIIVISGRRDDDMPELREQDLVGPSGATALFKKPFDTEALMASLRANCPVFDQAVGRREAVA